MSKYKNEGESADSYDSAFCNVTYISGDNIVLISWKKFCRLEDYRKPTLFAADLLSKNKNSNLIIDARNGFEDDKEDVAWGFSVLLPEMSQTDCEICVFIMHEMSGIEDEIDLWTLEFMKYFKVKKSVSYDQAIEQVRLHKEQSCETG